MSAPAYADSVPDPLGTAETSHPAAESLSAKLGAVLRKHRLELGLSQRGLAAITGHQRTHLGMIEDGLSNPSLEMVEDLARALGHTLGQLLAEAERS
jgi:DNA-binding XRE family transcriptional regulator